MAYSHKDFTGRNLSGEIIEPQEIRSSCFSQEIPDTHVFPEGMTGVTFVNCNLMNVFIPDGNTVIDCQTDRYAYQNDGNQWIIDENNIPLTVVDYLYFYKYKLLHPDPKDIPDAPVQERIKHEDIAERLGA